MRPFALLGLGLAVSTVLWALFPGAEMHAPEGNVGRDAVSLAYLRNVVRAAPHDSAARLRLGEFEAAIGQLDDAAATIAPLLAKHGESGRLARRLELTMALRRMDAHEAGAAARGPLLAQALRLVDRIMTLEGESVTGEDLERFARLKLSADRPRDAAALYERLAERDRSGRERWLLEAARWYRAGGEIDRAVDLQLAASFATVQPKQARAHALKALELRRAQGKPDAALALAEQLVKRFPKDREILDVATKLALASRDLRRARNWGNEQLRLPSSGPKTALQQIEVLLGSGDVQAALPLLEKLVKARPSDTALRRKLAMVATWASAPSIALEQWVVLARGGDADAREKALALARSSYDTKRTVALLENKAATEGLSITELGELADRLEDLADPAAAAAAMRKHGRRFTGDARYWRRLVAIHERQGELRAAFEASEEATTRLGPSLDDLAKQVELLWRMDQADAAFTRARTAETLATASDVAFWRLYADLAWTYAQAPEALKAYRMLWQHARPSPAVAERLLALASDAGDAATIITVGRQAYEKFGNPAHLLWALDVAHEANRKSDVRALLAMAEPREAQFRTASVYWTVKGYVYKNDRKLEGAQKAFERVLSLDPKSADARAELLWLALDRRDVAHLDRLARSFTADEAKNPRYWEPLALAHERLGNRDLALQLRRRQHEAFLAKLPADSRRLRADRRFGADGKLLPAKLRLAMAFEENDRGALRAVLENDARDLSVADRVAAARHLGQEESAWRMLQTEGRTVKVAAADGVAAEPTVITVEEAKDLQDARNELALDRTERFGAEARVSSLGDTSVLEQTASGTLRWDALGLYLGPEATARRVTLGKDGIFAEGDTQAEFYSGLNAELRTDGSRTSLAVGAQVLPESTLPSLRLGHVFRAGEDVEITVNGAWNELSQDTAGLRAVGVRRGLDGAIAYDLTARDRLEARFGLGRHATRGGSLLGWGTNAGATASRDLLTGPAVLTAHADLELGRYDVVNAMPDDIADQFAGFVAPEDILPSRFTTAGFGLTLATPPVATIGPARSFAVTGIADAWAGWLWPANRPTYSLEAGAALRIRGAHELGAKGFYSANAGGIAAQRHLGAALHYAIRWF